MDFTYKAYTNLITIIREHGYSIASYDDWSKFDKSVILRHDVDYDIGKALEFAALEKDIGVNSTYFVLLTGNFYNLFSKVNLDKLHTISSFGHEIGLHFDETQYDSLDNIELKIKQEIHVLEELLGMPVRTISMHRPSRYILDSDLQIDGIVNSYGKDFFSDIKYLSDSRRNWKEPVEDIIISEQFKRLQILTHAFWYNEQNLDIHDSIYRFVNSANKERYDKVDDNITLLSTIMNRDEVK